MAALISRRLPAIMALLLLTVACDDGMGPDRARIDLQVLPRFSEHEALATDPAALVDNVRVLVVGEEGDTAVDQVTEWPADQESIRIDVAVEVTGVQQLEFILHGRQASTVLFEARQLITLSSDDPAPAPTEMVLEYTGPETGLLAVSVVGPLETVLAGDQVQLEAVGIDEQGNQITDLLMAWSSLDTLAATVSADGVVQVEHDATRRVRVVGRVAFRSLADTIDVAVVPASLVLAQQPDTIVAIGFDQYTAARALGVNGEPVRTPPVQWSIRVPRLTIAEILPGYEAGPLTRVRAVNNGVTWLLASLGPLLDSVPVIVDQRVAASAPHPSRVIAGVGDSVHLTLAATDAGGTTIFNPDPAVWSSSDPVVASVDANGTVTANSAPDPISGAAVTGEINGTSFEHRFEVFNGETVGPTVSISLGDLHSCRIERADLQIFCQGDGSYGQLGNGLVDDALYSVETVNPLRDLGDVYSEVTAGGRHTCAVLDTVGGSQAFCWGDNRWGQLGDGTLENRSQPTPVDNSAIQVDLVSLSSGGGHTCGLSAEGQAYCWGSNQFGQLGVDTIGNAATRPQPVAGGLTFTQLSAGWLHTCGLTTDSTTWCWGRGLEGQLGNGTTDGSGAPVQVAGGGVYTSIVTGTAQTCGITSTGGVDCWGYNSSGQVGTGSTAFVVSTPAAVPLPAGVAVVDVALGRIHGCALTGTGPVYCWGGNDRLQLGQASPRAARSPILVPLPAGVLPTSIAAGDGQTCAVDGTRTLCWGGIPAAYLGRDVLVTSAELSADGAFSSR